MARAVKLGPGRSQRQQDQASASRYRFFGALAALVPPCQGRPVEYRTQALSTTQAARTRDQPALSRRHGLPAMAGHPMLGSSVFQRWLRRPALVLGIGTTGREGTARHPAVGTGRLSAHQRDTIGFLTFQPRRRGQQGTRVRMARMRKDFLGRRLLDDLSQIHDRDAIAQALDHRQVVRDEQVGEPRLRRRSSSRFSTVACTDMSRPEVGSSRITMRGASSRMRASATRRSCPPENSCG